jgi:5-bromo-4-chloroindolyl phosphate hydrolysis protein
MYKEINRVIDQIIELHKNTENEMTDRERHYFIQGLEVAKQQIEQLEEYHTTELAYETFEDTVRALKGNLDRYDMEVIIEDIFMDDDSEEDE